MFPAKEDTQVIIGSLSCMTVGTYSTVRFASPLLTVAHPGTAAALTTTMLSAANQDTGRCPYSNKGPAHTSIYTGIRSSDSIAVFVVRAVVEMVV